MGDFVVDALGRRLDASRQRTRVVSLVPSETETAVALAGPERLVGRTDFCEEPVGRVEHVPSVGGTKRFDPRAVIALAPDLVLANKEENGRSDVEALIAAGLDVHVSFPLTVADNIVYLESVARLLGQPDAGASERAALREWISGASPTRGRVAVPIWRDPWMTFDDRTYASDVLRTLGAFNVFSGRPRRYPLAADLRAAPELPAARTEDLDTRYPRFDWSELMARTPDAVLLPDEPYRFGEADRAELEASAPDSKIALVSGKDLFWYGVRTAEALPRLAAMLDDVLAPSSQRDQRGDPS